MSSRSFTLAIDRPGPSYRMDKFESDIKNKKWPSVNWFTLDLWNSPQALVVLGVVLLSGIKH